MENHDPRSWESLHHEERFDTLVQEVFDHVGGGGRMGGAGCGGEDGGASRTEMGAGVVMTGSAGCRPQEDGVLSAVVMEDLAAEPERALQNAMRGLRPGGVLVLSALNARYVCRRNAGPAFSICDLCRLLGESGFDVLRLRFCGTILYHPRLRWLRSLAPPSWWRAVGAFSNTVPLWRVYFSERLVAVARRPS